MCIVDITLNCRLLTDKVVNALFSLYIIYFIDENDLYKYEKLYIYIYMSTENYYSLIHMSY